MSTRTATSSRARTASPQVVIGPGDDGIPGTADDDVVEGNPAAPISPLAVGAVRTGHMFLADIAHTADPFSTQGVPWPPMPTMHRRRRRRLAGHLRRRAARRALHGRRRPREREHRPHRRPRASSTPSTTGSSIRPRDDTCSTLATCSSTELMPLAPPLDELVADVTGPGADRGRCSGRRAPVPGGEFGTEMQYQHLVFEEFARNIQPQVDAFLAPRRATTPRSIRRSSPSSRTRSIASATRC